MHVLNLHAPYGDLQCTDTIISGPSHAKEDLGAELQASKAKAATFQFQLATTRAKLKRAEALLQMDHGTLIANLRRESSQAKLTFSQF